PRPSRPEEDNVFGELAHKFVGFVTVLGEVADGVMASQARGERGLLRVYERWLKSGSPTLAAELCARGIVPGRGKGGLHWARPRLLGTHRDLCSQPMPRRCSTGPRARFKKSSNRFIGSASFRALPLSFRRPHPVIASRCTCAARKPARSRSR